MAKMYQKLALRGGEGGSEWDDDVYKGSGGATLVVFTKKKNYMYFL